MRTMTWFTAALVAVFLSLPLAVTAQTITAEAIAEAMGFGAEDRAKLEAGEIVSTEVEETTEKQLAVALALKVPATLEDVAASVAEGTTLEANKAIKAHGEIDPAKVSEAAFADITLDADEVARLLEGRARLGLQPVERRDRCVPGSGANPPGWADPGCRGRGQCRLAPDACRAPAGLSGGWPRWHRARWRPCFQCGRRSEGRGRRLQARAAGRAGAVPGLSGLSEPERGRCRAPVLLDRAGRRRPTGLQSLPTAWRSSGPTCSWCCRATSMSAIRSTPRRAPPARCRSRTA